MTDIDEEVRLMQAIEEASQLSKDVKGLDKDYIFSRVKLISQGAIEYDVDSEPVKDYTDSYVELNDMTSSKVSVDKTKKLIQNVYGDQN